MRMPRTRFAAHRGGAALWPENSALAFRNALAMGAPLLELDVHATVDGDAAVIHDPTLDRTTNASGPVAQRTADELRRVRLKSRDGALVDEGVPMLRDVLALAAPTPGAVLVEIKTPGPAVGFEGSCLVPGPRYPVLERRVLDELAQAEMADRAMVMAFNPAVLAQIRKMAPAQRTVLLVDRQAREAGVPGDAVVRWATEAGASFLGVHHALCDASLVTAAHRAGLGIGVFTVNDEATMRRLVGLGVDVIISDEPALVAKMEAAQ
jgi:glycerophosphoryl diester phosphodiesterase